MRLATATTMGAASLTPHLPLWSIVSNKGVETGMGLLKSLDPTSFNCTPIFECDHLVVDSTALRRTKSPSKRAGE